jgi:D-apionolactonase
LIGPERNEVVLSPSQAVKLYGTEEPVAATLALRAGPLDAVLDGGNLRRIRLHGREAIRGIGYIVRDRNWGTCAPQLSGLSVERDADGFRVRYQAACEAAGQTFGYRARIEGGAAGDLVFEVEGEPVTDFVTNRAGFVVLHGVAGVSGTAVEVEHVDGRIERSRSPELIDPACPFKDIRALSHEVLPRLRLTCRREGAAFEMEDQRNWTDASYKTYVRPLACPWPYTIPQGAVFTQRLTLEVAGVAAVPTARAKAAVRVWIEAGAGYAMPAVGLAVPASGRRPASSTSSATAPARSCTRPTMSRSWRAWRQCPLCSRARRRSRAAHPIGYSRRRSRCAPIPTVRRRRRTRRTSGCRWRRRTRASEG